MKIKKKVIKRLINGECFLVPVGTAVYEANGLFLLTELGEFIWDLLPTMDHFDDILNAILAEYDVEEAVAREDLSLFLNKLRDMGFI